MKSLYINKKKVKRNKPATFEEASYLTFQKREKVFCVLTHSFSYMRVKRGQTSIVQVPIRSDQVTAS